MSNKEILEKAIQKAIDNGWRGEYVSEDLEFGGFYYSGVKSSTLPMHSYPVIFNHDFAKALWGEGKPRFSTGWKGHLKNMVISEDPIKYLGDNL